MFIHLNSSDTLLIGYFFFLGFVCSLDLFHLFLLVSSLMQLGFCVCVIVRISLACYHIEIFYTFDL